MGRYLISFTSTAMDHIPERELPEVARAARAVMREAQDAGAWIFGGGLERTPASIVATDGAVSDGPYPGAIGGFCVVDTPSRRQVLGIAAKAALAHYAVAGKTGTSQVVKLRDGSGAVPYEHRDHALFVAFAPYDKPEVAVAVVIEHGEHGGAAAAPIAGAILRKYFEQKGVIKRPVRPTDDEETEDGEADAAPEGVGVDYLSLADRRAVERPQPLPGPGGCLQLPQRGLADLGSAQRCQRAGHPHGVGGADA